jgi:hypothetical protein
MFQLAYPAIPQTTSFQGILKDGSGHQAGDSTYSVIFSIYSDPLSGNQLWSESQSVTTSNGLFNCVLGNVHPIPDSAFQNSAFIGFGIEGQPEMTPRIALQSVPYSYTSNYASNADKVDGYHASDLWSQVYIPPQNIFRVTMDAFRGQTPQFTTPQGKIRYITTIWPGNLQLYEGCTFLINGQIVCAYYGPVSGQALWSSDGGAPIVVLPGESFAINITNGLVYNLTVTGYEFDYVPPRGR